MGSGGSYIFPCNAVLPSFTFGAAGAKFVVPVAQLVFSALADGVNCYGTIQSSGDESEGFFGAPFLESLFVVHDLGAMILGFAQGV